MRVWARNLLRAQGVLGSFCLTRELVRTPGVADRNPGFSGSAADLLMAREFLGSFGILRVRGCGLGAAPGANPRRPGGNPRKGAGNPRFLGSASPDSLMVNDFSG